MRYRLRTLLIAMACFGACFAWIGYLRRMAAYHNLAADRFSVVVAEAESISSTQLETAIDHFIDEGWNRFWPITGDEDTHKIARYFLYRLGKPDRWASEIPDSTTDQWERFLYHRLAAREYSQAALHPWNVKFTISLISDDCKAHAFIRSRKSCCRNGKGDILIIDTIK